MPYYYTTRKPTFITQLFNLFEHIPLVKQQGADFAQLFAHPALVALSFTLHDCQSSCSKFIAATAMVAPYFRRHVVEILRRVDPHAPFTPLVCWRERGWGRGFGIVHSIHRVIPCHRITRFQFGKLSTGASTPEGEAALSRNAHKGGLRSLLREISALLREQRGKFKEISWII